MRKRDLARNLARRTGVSHAEAADEVDRLVNDILQKLRSGETAALPGFGRFRRDADGNIQFHEESGIAKR